MQNYFNYFTEIEEHFQQRRGSLLLLSTLDWALIELWRDAGIPLEVALRGIDAAFDKHEARQRRGPLRRVNGLAWCAQAVMEAAEQQKEAAIGTSAPSETEPEDGFETQRIAEHLESGAAALHAAATTPGAPAPEALTQLSARLRALVQELPQRLTQVEDLERQLTVLEEKLFATLTTAVPEEMLLQFKTEAARDLSAYRSRMSAVQLRQVEQQFVHKRLLEHYQIPRFSLFYMRQA